MSDGHDVYEAAREEYRKKIRELAEENERLRAALRRARTVLTNMTLEYGRWGSWMGRWQISHEPLRADAKNLLPVIEAALTKQKEQQ